MENNEVINIIDDTNINNDTLIKLFNINKTKLARIKLFNRYNYIDKSFLISHITLFLKNKDFINTVVLANKNDCFYSDSVYFFYNRKYNFYIYYKHIFLFNYLNIEDIVNPHQLNFKFHFLKDTDYNVYNILSLNNLLESYKNYNSLIDKTKEVYNNEPYIPIFQNYKSFINL
jgi:hypothetical protein